MPEKRKRYNAKVAADHSDYTGVFAISFVDYPAIEVDFIAMSRVGEPREILQRANAVTFKAGLQGLVTGPVLIPDKPILRYSEERGGYYDLFFDADTIRVCAERFQHRHYQQNANTDHAYPVNLTTFVETWIIEDSTCDKARVMGFDLPKGTWMVTARVTDPEVLKRIQDGELRGFSVEAYLHQIEEQETVNDKPIGAIDMSVKPNFLNALAQRLLGKGTVKFAQYASGETVINVDDTTGEARYIVDGELGDIVPDGIYVVNESGEMLVVFAGKWVRTTTSKLGAELEMILQKGATAEKDRQAWIDEILAATSLTSEEFEAVLAWTGGCLLEEKLTAIEGVFSLEAGTLKAYAEEDGCDYGMNMTDVAEQTGMAVIKDAANRFFKSGLVSPVTLAKESAEKMAAHVADNGAIIYISIYDGGTYFVDQDLYPSSYVPAGEYSLIDGRRIVIQDAEEVYNEGTEWEWTWQYTQLNFDRSEITVGDLLPWIKEQQESVNMAKVEAETKLKSATAEIETLKAEASSLKKELDKLKASETSLKAEVKRLGSLPATGNNPPKDNIEQMSAAEQRRAYHQHKVEFLNRHAK